MGILNPTSSGTSATSQNQTTSYISPWAQPVVANLINQQMANMFPNQTVNADGSINLGQQAGYTAFGQNGAGIGPNQMAAAQSAVAGFSPLQKMAQQGAANLSMPGQFGTATTMAGNAGQGLLGTVNPAMAYGNLGSTMGIAAAGMAPQAQQYGQAGANIGTQGGLGYGAVGNQAGQMGAGYGALGTQQGLSYGQNATNPSAVQAYMNPYLQATLNPALQLQQQQFNQIQAQNQGQATAAGAFGGGRQAVQQGLNQQNQMLAQNQLVGNAYNQAYNTANQNMQQAAALGMQGAGLGIQGQQAAISGANTGLQGVNTALQGQQLGLSGLNTANTLYNTGIAGANAGLAGVNAAQAGYTGANTAAANLGNLGTQQLAAQNSILNTQNTFGNQQQANQQAVINQAIQNYANAQNYPMQQAYNLMGLTTGIPTSQTQTNYVAPPSALNTAVNVGAAATGAALVKAKGGIINAKRMASGGIVSFDVGGSVESELYDMDVNHLTQEAKSSPSMEIRKYAARILAERQLENQAMARGVGAASGGMVNMAGGGIVAFSGGGGAKMTEDEAQGLLYGRLPAGSAKRLEAPTEDLGNYSDPYNAMGEAIPPNASEGSFSRWFKEHTYGTRENLGLPPKEEKAVAKKTDLKPDSKGRYVANSEPDSETSTRSGTGSAKGSSTSGQAQSSTSKTPYLDNYMTALQDKYGYGKPTEYELEQREQYKKDRAEAAKSHENNLALALIRGAGKGLQNTSPFAGPGIGNLLETGAESYAKGNADYDAALAKLRSGELDLAKLSSTDRNNLLHYASTMAAEEQRSKEQAASRLQGINREALLDKRLLAQEIMKLQADPRYMDKSPQEIRTLAMQSLGMDVGANPVQLNKSQLALLNKYK